MKSCETIRNDFPDDWEKVKALHLKITTDELEKRIKTKNDDNSLSIIDTIKSTMPNPEEELLDKEQKEEAQNEAQKEKAENIKKLEIFRNRVIELFRERFRGENDWLSFIQKKSISELWDNMQDYPPNSFGSLKNAINSKLYKEYYEILNISKEFRGEYHTRFATKLRLIANILEAEGVKYEGR